MVVLFDFDEVFVDLNTGAIKYINEKLGTNYTYDDVKSWEFFDNPTVRKPFFDFLSLPDVYQKHVIPNKKMIKVLEQMVEMGKEVYIVTASVESSQDSKYKFIKEHMPFFDTKNLFTVNSSSKYKMKSDVLEELNLDYHEPTVLVDDGIHNILDMMADINHKEKLDGMMKQFYISRTIKKFNNPFHDFIYGIVPELVYNKTIDDGKRIYKLKETKDIWSILKTIESQHKNRVEIKQAEVFNYINNIVNDNLLPEQFKTTNELQNNVSFVTKNLLSKENKFADFLSDTARLCVKVLNIEEHSDTNTTKEIFEICDKRFGSDVMYNEIKNIVKSVCSSQNEYDKNVLSKYSLTDSCGSNLLNTIIDIASSHKNLSSQIINNVDNDKIQSLVTSLLHKSGLAYDIDFTNLSSISANINLALNKNKVYNSTTNDIEVKDESIDSIKSEIIGILTPSKRRKP